LTAGQPPAAGQFEIKLAGAAEWLRRLARDPGVSPWLLLEQFGALVALSRPPEGDYVRAGGNPEP
jgi:hypothetical protein